MKQRNCLLVKVNSEPVDANLDFRVWTIRSESLKQQDQSNLFLVKVPSCIQNPYLSLETSRCCGSCKHVL